MNRTCGKNLVADCNIALGAKVIGDLWTLMIVRDLLKGPQRFKDLESSLHGISTKTLCSRLHVMEKHGLIKRYSYNEVPPRVEYKLTDKGTLLKDLIDKIEEFGKIISSDQKESI